MPPIIAALRHHKTTVVLVALEIAITCAIMTNALAVIGSRIAAMRVTTGVADDQLVWVNTNDMNLGQQVDRAGLPAADMAALRAMPGVKSVAMTDGLPLNGNYISTVLYRRAGDKHDAVDNTVMYLGTPGVLKTLGVHLSAGRAFKPSDFVDYHAFGKTPPPSVMIITRPLADKLWPGQNPLGKPVYLDESGKQVVYVVGVVDHLLNPAINQYQGAESGFILPVKVVHDNALYVLRVARDSRRAVAQAIPAVLHRIDPARIVKAHVYTDTIAEYFHGDRAMVWLLVAVIACLLAVTALGVVGLSSFWVQQRTRTIGIRRALGATRGDILRYFQTENFIIVTLGVVIGMALAVGLNLLLMQHYELARMPLWYLPIGAGVLWVLGQLAVLAPALRAAHVSPMVATRSV
ncbi:MAG TPA: FtsX-like permease family protein [Rhodanobacteraceae bacterium]